MLTEPGRCYYLLPSGAQPPPRWGAPAGASVGDPLFYFIPYLESITETTLTKCPLCLAFKINTLEFVQMRVVPFHASAGDRSVLTVLRVPSSLKTVLKLLI